MALRATKGDEDFSAPAPSCREREGRYRLLTCAALIGAVTGLALWRARERLPSQGDPRFNGDPLALRAAKGDEYLSA